MKTPKLALRYLAKKFELIDGRCSYCIGNAVEDQNRDLEAEGNKWRLVMYEKRMEWPRVEIVLATEFVDHRIDLDPPPPPRSDSNGGPIPVNWDALNKFTEECWLELAMDIVFRENRALSVLAKTLRRKL